MTASSLPKRLRKEPLLDALFECRFDVPFSLTTLLPGLVHQRLGGKSIQPLPHSNIPLEIRKLDVNLKFSPLISVTLEHFTVLIGDQSISVSCHMPYQGWKVFKAAILQVIGVIVKSGIEASIVRYSLKYIDLIDADLRNGQDNLIELNLSLGGYDASNLSYHVRLDVLDGDFVNIIQVTSGSKIVMLNTNSEREGVVLDIDTIRDSESRPITDVVEGFSSELEKIHDESKLMFFKCITKYCLEKLEPEYE